MQHVQAIEEILSEPAHGHQLLQVLVGGRDDTDIDADHILATHATELALLEDSKEFGLRQHRHLPDLVEENGPFVGQFEEATPRIDRACEGALLVTEELALQEGLGEGGNVYRDERAVAPRREVMDSSRNQLLTCPRLTRDEHR